MQRDNQMQMTQSDLQESPIVTFGTAKAHNQLHAHFIHGVLAKTTLELLDFEKFLASTHTKIVPLKTGLKVVASAIDLVDPATKMVAPSVMKRMLDLPELAQTALGVLMDDADTTLPSPFVIATLAMIWLEDDVDVTQRALRVLQPSTGKQINWVAHLNDADMKRGVLAGLASNAAVADIEAQWGAGSALRLGQYLAKSLRDGRKGAAKALSIDSPVHGRA